MHYHIVQKVDVVDMNNEIISEVFFEHGDFTTTPLSIGTTIIMYPLGLKGFEVVYDRRFNNPSKYKVEEIEINLMQEPTVTRVFLEPVKLILGQHDIGEM
ncbi:hypothetical protein [Paenibacillus aestuarii]|uniref:Uncharacterized protein n=1 Tax=Paenibacillus aestuarii TaxID=516965 RepID=A0ABW0KH22_9BACL|nr:hypothetical protein [Paenibacillus aestuarii]